MLGRIFKKIVSFFKRRKQVVYENDLWDSLCNLKRDHWADIVNKSSLVERGYIGTIHEEETEKKIIRWFVPKGEQQ